MTRSWSVLVLCLLGCSDFTITEAAPLPPADPPGSDDEDYGDSPDWEDCPGGYLGRYFNHAVDHPDMEPEDGVQTPDTPDTLDWWDDSYLSFERFDASTDHGPNWWPVDEGYEGDPSYFAVQFKAWLRVFSQADVSFVMGSSDDAWLLLDDEVRTSLAGVHDYEVEAHVHNLLAGQYQLELLFAHRQGDSGFSFRVAGDNAKICFGEYESNTDDSEEDE